MGRRVRVGAFGTCLADWRVRFATHVNTLGGTTALRASADASSTVQARPHLPSPVVRLLVAAGTSFYGDWLTTVALVVLLFRLTASPVGPALYIVARAAPQPTLARLVGLFD